MVEQQLEIVGIEPAPEQTKPNNPTKLSEKNTEKAPKSDKRSVKERRQQVLTVLTHMLHSERGMERMTTARLAEEIGVSEAALYRYFPSKTKMFEALIDNLESNLFSRINHSIKNETNTMNRVRDILQMILDFARKNPGLTRVLTGHALMFEDPKLQARVAQFFDRLEFQFVNILQMRKLREGRAFSLDERIIASYLVNLCEGQFMRYVRSNFRHNSNQNFEQQWKLIAVHFA
ncbi:nucleoid occlusion factor SlmA [Avibacterium endocarditidis]|uniref:Nucleoid occlusion factor SlmA n=1 Tax=Avibacterium endocarditidis TaxID=380674 RepID=A0ABX4ZTN8_9PAST|nr:nucleoid occlusion factor SlmA [Avibacterium endocarditidis]POY42315.1 nucleoid occlusion factor SlmA [Avibacterium endocarditidis]